MTEDWPLLLSFFPNNWIELAGQTDALKKLRKDKDVENYLRTLLLHIGCGYSLRETATRAKLAGLADISDVALLGRLKKAKDWLHSLCVILFQEQGIGLGDTHSDFQVRLFDATNIKEPGPTGSLWRIHYSVRLPTLACDFFKITPTRGKGTGESFFQYSIKAGDYIIADRGYSTASGIHHVVSKKAYVIVRVNTSSLPIWDMQQRPVVLLNFLQPLKKTEAVKSLKVLIPKRNGSTIEGRLCVVRKSNAAIKLAHKRIKTNASKKGTALKPETLEYAKYVMVFSTYPESRFSDIQILDWYRCRWQVELVFKRFKSIAQLGHLPKHSDDSSKAWLYGKLFVALVTNKLINYATSFSPWGYILEENSPAKCLA
ncbi:MAG: IS4 family transposase [Deltaproteobacteria bacterium]|jgi:hypothetical protein